MFIKNQNETGKRRMKKTYEKPTLEKRGALGSVATIGQVLTGIIPL
jgi:hypothetical protein